MSKTKVLVLSELYYPYGGGAEYATHLILKNLQRTGSYEITVLVGVKNIERISGVKYIYTRYLRPRAKPLFWAFIDYVSRSEWFKDLLKNHDVLYIPRIAYPAIPQAKKLGKKVVVHLHNYQPITYHSIYSEIDGNLNNPVRFEVLEHQSVARAVAVGLIHQVNKLVKHWLLQADRTIQY